MDRKKYLGRERGDKLSIITGFERVRATTALGIHQNMYSQL